MSAEELAELIAEATAARHALAVAEAAEIEATRANLRAGITTLRDAIQSLTGVPADDDGTPADPGVVQRWRDRRDAHRDAVTALAEQIKAETDPEVRVELRALRDEAKARRDEAADVIVELGATLAVLRLLRDLLRVELRSL